MGRRPSQSGARRTLRRLGYGGALAAALLAVTMQSAPEIRVGLTPLRSAMADILAPRGEGRPQAERDTAWNELTDGGNKDEIIRRLERRVQELSRYELAAVDLAFQVETYEEMLRLMGDPAPGEVTARVVTEVDGPFSETRLANAGADQGVQVGAAAVNDAGLVGHVVRVGRKTSRILLLTDYNSRVPVVGEVSGVRAILYGESDGEGMLTDFPEDDGFVPGERVLTSGEGGVFQPGLLVGRTYKDEDGWRVALAMKSGSTSYVRILAPVRIAPPEDDPVPEPDGTAITAEAAGEDGGAR